MENEAVRKIINELAGRRVCDDCADAFLAILDRVRDQRAHQRVVPLVPSPRNATVPIPTSTLAALRASLRPVELTGGCQ